MPIARLHSDICPVAMLEHYFRLGDIKGNTDKQLFRGLTSTKQDYRLQALGGISYSPRVGTQKT